MTTKRTWKLRGMPEAAEALRTSGSIRKAAAKAGVSPSTFSRAIKAGKLPDPRRPVNPVATGQSPRNYPSFSAWARGTFYLSPGEDELVSLGQQALDIAKDATESRTTQLAAMREYRAIWRDLHLPNEEEANYGNTPAKTNRESGTWPRRVIG